MTQKYKSQNYGIAGVGDGKINRAEEVDRFLEGYKENDNLKQLLTKMYQEIHALSDTVNTKASTAQLQQLAGVVDTKASTEQLQELSGVVSTKASTEQLQELTGVVNTKASKSLVEYEDIYIGVAADSATIISENFHHDAIVHGRPIYFTNPNGYLWIVLPSIYEPAVALMNSVEILMTVNSTINVNDIGYKVLQMSVDSTTTIDGVEYKVWKSANSFTDSFNILLF